MSGAEIPPFLSDDEIKAAVALGFNRVKHVHRLNDEDIADAIDRHRDMVRAYRKSMHECGSVALIRAVKLWPEEFAAVVKMLCLGQRK